METIKANTESIKVNKGFHGWEAESNENFNGYDWKITTLKRSNGIISCMAQAGELAKSGSFIFTMFQDPNIKLFSTKGRATEKTVKEIHIKGLLAFDKMKEAGELPKNGNLTPTGEKYEIPVGQIFEIHNPMCLDNRTLICYRIEETRYGKRYLTVNPDNLQLGMVDHPKPWSQKFGIGTYYTEGNIFEDLDELNNMVIEAKEKERKEKEQKEAENILKENLRLAKIEEGKKLVHIPNWAKCVIVADNYRNDSDAMTDYFSTSISQTVYLAFSRTTRNNMQELKNASQLFEGTKDFLTNPNVEEYTHGHSYLPDYFLGTPRWFGWKVNKRKYFDLSKEENRNLLYIAAAEGRYFIKHEEEEPKAAEEVSAEGLQLVDYSDRALAIIGDTKPHKDTLKSLGGRFNFRLKCGAGWIFPKTKAEEINQVFGLSL